MNEMENEQYEEAAKHFDMVVIEKYSELTSYYSSNTKRTMFSAPSVGYSINSATKTMTDACNNKIRSCGINISNDVLEKVNTTTKENNNSKRALFILIGIGVAIFVIYEIITWIQISSI